MGKIKIKIHPLFFLFAGLLIFFGHSFLFFNYLLVIFLHELAHALVAKKLGYEIKNITIYPFGICLNMDTKIVCANDEIKIAIAGPFFNLVLVFLCISLWWLYPSVYLYTYYFCFANFITFIVNLLPVYPLDGGRVFLGVLLIKGNKESSVKWCKFLNIVVSLSLLFLFFISLFYSINLTFLFMSIFVFVGAFDKSEKSSYNFLDIENKLKFKNRVCKIKQIAVMEDLEVFKLIKHINTNTITEFVVVDKNNLVSFKFLEFDLQNIYNKIPPTSPVRHIKKVVKVGF